MNLIFYCITGFVSFLWLLVIILQFNCALTASKWIKRNYEFQFLMKLHACSHQHIYSHNTPTHIHTHKHTNKYIFYLYVYIISMLDSVYLMTVRPFSFSVLASFVFHRLLWKRWRDAFVSGIYLLCLYMIPIGNSSNFVFVTTNTQH